MAADWRVRLDMRVQRTRSSALPSRSLLTCWPFGAHRKRGRVALRMAGLVLLSVPALPPAASAAVQLIVSNDPCNIYPCPLPPPPPTHVGSGAPFLLAVVALNADGEGRDASYRGTVHFSSTDPRALLPSDYTFTAGDAGAKGFTVFLSTLGSQTISGVDDSVPPLSGSLTLTVIAAAQSIPTLTRGGAINLALALALAGALVARQWRPL